MQIIVVFDYKDIDDPDSQEASDAISALEDDIKRANISCDAWWIEDACTDTDENTDENTEDEES